jgi:hypothetical protein
VTVFTIDPRVPPSDPLRVAALHLLDRRPDLVRRPNRSLFLVPSWTEAAVDHQVVVIFAAGGWRVTCDCTAGEMGRACKHGWVAAIKAERDDGSEAPVPPDPARREPARAS